MRVSMKLDDQVCFALYSASRAITGRYRPMLDELGLTYPQYLVMLVLWERGTVSVSELGTALRLDSGTLSPLLKRMAAGGLVTRTRRADDERGVHIEPTEHGKSLRAKASEVPENLWCEIDLPVDELVALRDILRRVTDAATSPPHEGERAT